MIEKLTETFKGLGKREKIFVIALSSILIISIYYNLFYKPLSRNTKNFVFQSERLKTRLEELKGRYPELYEKEARVKELNAGCEKLLKEIVDLENKLPSKSSTSALIGEFTRLAKDVKIESIRQKIDEGEEYSRIFIELRFDAPYKRTVHYLRGVETISPFLVVEELEIAEPSRRKKKKATFARIVVSSLLGDVPFSEQLKAKEIDETSLEFRDIFVSKARPAVLDKKLDVKLEGITYNAVSPTAILDGEVVREDSAVKGFTVKKILPETVVLTDGIQDYVLNVER